MRDVPVAAAPLMQASLKRRVGVLGGGQLGRMMAFAAHRLGIHLTVLDPMGADVWHRRC